MTTLGNCKELEYQSGSTKGKEHRIWRGKALEACDASKDRVLGKQILVRATPKSTYLNGKKLLN